MRTPDGDGPDGGSTSGQVGDGFGASADDLTDGFGDDFPDDGFGDSTDTTGTGDSTGTDGGFGDDTGGTGGTGDSTDTDDTPFGDGLSDAEAENVLVEILEDVFGEDGPGALDDAEADTTSVTEDDVFDALENALSAPGLDDGTVVDEAPVDPFDPFEPSDIPSESDFDFTGDGLVDGADLHEAAHPFDFDVTE